ncbi:hypothetical protein [Deinococcus pimensis]|uniref:hypothetical protein n=1 Tax=Deinococcus pimensis TaxID=309888 RepID=UPI0004818443|nr:hypothetical protein [Deinococcus pimensis]
MEAEMFNTLVGPLLFALIAGTWGFFQRPEKRDQLLWALTLLFVFASGVYHYFPSLNLFGVLAVYGVGLGTLMALFFQQAAPVLAKKK